MLISKTKAAIRHMVMDSYSWFVDLVADRRKLPREEVLKLADGAIFTGRQALNAKLVDKLGGDEDIRAYLESRGVSKDLPVVEWKERDSSSSFWLTSAVPALLKQLGFGEAIAPETLRALGVRCRIATVFELSRAAEGRIRTINRLRRQDLG